MANPERQIMTFRHDPDLTAALIAAWQRESTDNRFGLGWRAGERVAELESEWDKESK